MSSAVISLVVPMYNVARYLADFLGSLDEQTANIDDLEIVFVDDGSTDDSAAIIEKWIAGGRANARIVSKPNGGLASARNRGMEEITGDWVTFPDPDDRFSPNYFAEVRRFLDSDKARKAHLVACSLMMLDDATGVVSNSHPLRFKFAKGERVVDLVRFPDNIQLQAASAFYRRSLLDKFGLTFDHRIRPNFEDASLTALYLANFDRPRLGVIPSASYIYRKRADGTSLVQGSWRSAAKYTDLLEFGYLALLKSIAAQRGQVPLWVQNLVLYDLAFYFRSDIRPNSPTGGITDEVSERFHELLRQILDYIDVAAIEDFHVTWTTPEMRAALVIGGKGVQAVPSAVNVDEIDTGRRLVRVRYYFAGERPEECFRARGYVVEPVHAKDRSVRLLGRTMMYQRIVWLPATGTLTVELNGKGIPLLLGRGPDERYHVGPSLLWQRLAKTRAPADIYAPKVVRRGVLGKIRKLLGPYKRKVLVKVRRLRDVPKLKQDIRDGLLKRHARLPHVRMRFANAWLLIDRDSQAQDNAERLYQYLREHERQINAWFVLSRDSTDWDRLERAGFRLIEHGSKRHWLALLNCRHVISSQIDHYIVHPMPKRFGTEKWHYTFLQHGVTKDDLSVWINPKPIDLMITATPDEHESIVADGTPYVLTSREVKMTGFPRHDRLLDLATRTPKDERTLILIMPTWRRELVLDSISGGNDRQLRHDFWDTDYAVQWRGVIESPRLQELADKHGLEICFVPHPNMQDYLETSPLADHVRVHRFKNIDIQEILAKSAVLVTDYSSMGFEMAYLERPVIYFQFDRKEFFSGVHAYRRGTWSYDDDGFGPVCLDADATVDEVGAVLARAGDVGPVYADRMRTSFPLRDGDCCRRTFEAIRDLDRELTYAELYLRKEPAEVLNGSVVD